MVENIVANKQKMENNSEIEEKKCLIEFCSFQMRRKGLSMELDVIKKFFNKKLIGDDNYTLITIETIEIYCKLLCYADLGNFEVFENYLPIAEETSSEQMQIIKKVIKKKNEERKREEVQEPADNIQVPDYRSIVTVRGTKEDVTNCILKAKKAFENGKYDRAENLLLKAERIFPTKNARDLLKEIRAAKKSNENPEPIEKATEPGEQVNIVKKEQSKSEEDGIVAVKFLTAFEKAFSAGDLQKAERMLNKAKRMDPLLDVAEKLNIVKVATTNKRESECLYKSRKAYDIGDLVLANEILLQAKTFDPTLNLEPELSKIRKKMVAKCNEENPKTENEQTITATNMKCVADCLYKVKKAYKSGDLRNVELNLNRAKLIDESKIIKNSEKNKDERDEQAKNGADKSSKTSNKNKLENVDKYVKQARHFMSIGELDAAKVALLNAQSIYSTSTVKSLMEQVEKGLEKSKTSQNSSKYSADLKIKKRPTNKEHAENLVSMAEKAIHDEKFDDALDFLNNSEELYPTAQAKELLNNITEINSRVETKILSNCYELPVEQNEADQAEGLKCIKIAQNAFDKGQLDKAERFLLKSQRICNSQTVESFLEKVRNAKIINCYNNKHVNDRSLNEKTTEYNKCIDLATNASDENDLAKAEHFLSKAIRINPNDDAKNQLKNVQEVRTSQLLNDKATTSKTLKCDDDLELQGEAEMFLNLAADAMSSFMFYVARYYLECALQIRPYRVSREMLCVVNEEIGRGQFLSSHDVSSIDFKYEAKKLLHRVERCIRNGDLKLAESFLVVSWDMYMSRHTTLVHKKFLEARLANERKKGHCGNGLVFESDTLVLEALNKYQTSKFEEAEELLKKASNLHPSIRINRLLDEIGRAKNTGNVFQTFCTRAFKKWF